VQPQHHDAGAVGRRAVPRIGEVEIEGHEAPLLGLRRGGDVGIGTAGEPLIVDPTLVVFPHSPQSWNAYDYSRNNPTNVFDPDGELPTVTAGQMC